MFRPIRDESNSTIIRRPLGQFILEETGCQLSCRTPFSDISNLQRSSLILPCLCGRVQTVNSMRSGCRDSGHSTSAKAAAVSTGGWSSRAAITVSAFGV